jgi:serine/threonine protein phosphatase PrpC
VCLEAVSPPLAAPRRPRRTRHALSPRPFLPIAGTTMTLALVSGWLVTIANTGDSSAGIDTGNHTSEITVSHRIQVTKGCRRRARAPRAPSGRRRAPRGRA